jgi:hypothetical protein
MLRLTLCMLSIFVALEINALLRYSAFRLPLLASFSFSALFTVVYLVPLLSGAQCLRITVFVVAGGTLFLCRAPLASFLFVERDASKYLNATSAPSLQNNSTSYSNNNHSSDCESVCKANDAQMRSDNDVDDDDLHADKYVALPAANARRRQQQSRHHVACDPVLGCDANVDLLFGPTMTIRSAAEHVCQGDDAQLSISMSGIGPWSVAYHRVDAFEHVEIDNVVQTPHIANVSALALGEHRFELGPSPLAKARGDASDAALLFGSQLLLHDRSCPAIALLGSATVRVHERPRVAEWWPPTLACDGTNATLSIEFAAGTPPFAVTVDSVLADDFSVRWRASLRGADDDDDQRQELAAASAVTLSLGVGTHSIVDVVDARGCALLPPADAKKTSRGAAARRRRAAAASGADERHRAHATFTIEPLSQPGARLVDERVVRCAASPRADLVPVELDGTPPFRVRYSVQRVGSDGGDDAELVRTVTVQADALPLRLVDEGHGDASTLLYRLLSVDDAHCAGSVAGSALSRLVSHAPTALLAGGRCAGDDVVVALRDGDAPWCVTLRDLASSALVEHANVATSSVVLAAGAGGGYELVGARDQHCKAALVEPRRVEPLPRPSARLRLAAPIDADARAAELEVTLLGSAPFSFVLRSAESQQRFDGVAAEPPLLVDVAEEGNYVVEELRDATGCAPASARSRNVRIAWPRPPTVSIRPSLVSVCEGQTARALFTFTGSPPFHVALADEAGNDSGVAAESTIESATTTHNFETQRAGVYAVRTLRDRHFELDGRSELVLDEALEVRVMPLPDARLRSPTPTLGACERDADSLHADIELSGAPPFSVVYERESTSGARTEHSMHSIDERRHRLALREPGSYRLAEVSDSSGCARRFDASSPSVRVVLSEAPLSCRWLRDMICPTAYNDDDDNALLSVECTGGSAPPFALAYRVVQSSSAGAAGGADVHECTLVVGKHGRGSAPHVGVLHAGARIELVSVSNAHGCTRSLEGTSPPVHVPLLSTARIEASGAQQQCDDAADFSLRATLSGEGPWALRLASSSLDDDAAAAIVSVARSPHTFSVRDAGHYRLHSVLDRHGCAGAVEQAESIHLSRQRPLMAWMTCSTLQQPHAVCAPDAPVRLRVDLMGTPPWQLVYSDGTREHLVDAIGSTPLHIDARSTGRHSLVSVRTRTCAGQVDPAQCNVVVRPLPTASISGGGTVCAGGQTTDLVVHLTGTPPWTFTVRHLDEDGQLANAPPTLYADIRSSPFSFSTAEPGTYFLHSIQDQYCSYERGEQ